MTGLLNWKHCLSCQYLASAIVGKQGQVLSWNVEGEGRGEGEGGGIINQVHFGLSTGDLRLVCSMLL